MPDWVLIAIIFVLGVLQLIKVFSRKGDTGK